jgi:hypothetical protein
MNAEGWYHDPFGSHEARWFSDGHPTQLVRDGDIEAHDPPPEISYTGQLERVETAAASGPDDMRRADDRETDVDVVAEALWVFGETAGTD